MGLLHKPRLLFMDEPTVGIDPQSRRAILDSVKELNRQGMTVLYTTHYMEEAEELSDRVGIIDHGELIALGTQAELTHQVGENDALILHLGEGEDPTALAAAVRKHTRRVEGGRERPYPDHPGTGSRRDPGAGDRQGQRDRHQNPLGRDPGTQPGSGFPAPDRARLARLTEPAMKKVFLIGWKDLTLAFRDRAALTFMLLAPFLLTLGLGFVTGAFSGSSSSGVSDIPVIIVNQDGGQLGNALVEVFQSPDLAELVEAQPLDDPDGGPPAGGRG